ncbi:MAG: nucleotidyltransferase domain-containing protein [Prevotellaceae bacterium]|jgi:predicted nucleotidyltransferase|nr:nucleotidyltransferase domain-containing protein [Prevotellaceae bacterium]
MFQEIQDKLDEVERINRIRIVYACESGSRVWGFPSPDSGCDVRFIYVRSKNDYLSIVESGDSLEMSSAGKFEMIGWDLRKTLRLFRKSEVSIFEWLQSPAVYRRDSGFVGEMKSFAADYFSPRTGVARYLDLTKSVWQDMQGEEIGIRKYFQCLRAVLSALWIIENRDIPPTEFSALRTLITDSEWQNIVGELLDVKSEANEMTSIRPVALLQTFIGTCIQHCETNLPEADREDRNIERLNVLFRKQLREA